MEWIDWFELIRPHAGIVFVVAPIIAYPYTRLALFGLAPSVPDYDPADTFRFPYRLHHDVAKVVFLIGGIALLLFILSGGSAGLQELVSELSDDEPSADPVLTMLRITVALFLIAVMPVFALATLPLVVRALWLIADYYVIPHPAGTAIADALRHGTATNSRAALGGIVPDPHVLDDIPRYAQSRHRQAKAQALTDALIADRRLAEELIARERARAQLAAIAPRSVITRIVRIFIVIAAAAALLGTQGSLPIDIGDLVKRVHTLLEQEG